MAISYLPGQIELSGTAPQVADLLARRSAEKLKPENCSTRATSGFLATIARNSIYSIWRAKNNCKMIIAPA
jgi:hypothetical protein